MKITASHLYSYTECHHRIWRDTHDDPKLKDPVNEFTKLLWEHGTRYEKEIIESHIESGVEVLDLSIVPKEERFNETIKAMKRKCPCIYHGRLEVDNLLGEPDLLHLQEDGEYVPVDIKSGMGVKGGEEGNLKRHYALQLALYTDALRRLGFASHHKGFIWDSRGEMIEYDLTLPRSKRNPEAWWNYYEETLLIVKNILGKKKQTKPALSSKCGQCEWYSDCKKQCIKDRSLSLVPELGYSRQESLEDIVHIVDDLAKIKISDHLNQKGETGISGIGELLLTKFQRRAELLTSGEKDPLILKNFHFPKTSLELFFDIETDPTQDIVYLHGVVERKNGDNSSSKFHAFCADEVSNEAEKKAWKEFWDYIRSLPDKEWTMYYYSSYEKTQYKNLVRKYPKIADLDDVEWLFDKEHSIDLYLDVVKPCTEWPTYNYSVKTLAQHLGFQWRDENPSGAASIQWFNEWREDKNPEKLQRILHYNEDDCTAMMWIKDYLENYNSKK